MKKLNITKEQFNRSNYFQRKYGKLEYVSESGKLFKTNNGKVLMFKESSSRYGLNDVKTDGDVFRAIEGICSSEGMDSEFIFTDCARHQVVWGLEEKLLNGEDLNTIDRLNIACLLASNLDHDDSYEPIDGYNESTRKFGKKFNEEVHPHETDADVPVTEQEKMLCDYIADEIEGELNEEMGLELTCGCSWHNPGEEQHIEIFVGIPEGDDQMDPKYENIETFLEQFVNKIGGEENEGEKWGDASFQWISD